MKPEKPKRGGQPGNRNATKRGNDSVLTIACTRREKAGWVRAASGDKLSAWVREKLNDAAAIKRQTL